MIPNRVAPVGRYRVWLSRQFLGAEGASFDYSRRSRLNLGDAPALQALKKIAICVRFEVKVTIAFAAAFKVEHSTKLPDEPSRKDFDWCSVY